MKVIFIAAKYRGETHDDVFKNIIIAREAAIAIWRLGHVAVCPHTNSAFMSGAAKEHLFLEGYKELLKRCDAVFVDPTLPPGYQPEGVADEVATAEAHGISVFYNILRLMEWLQNQGEEVSYYAR